MARALRNIKSQWLHRPLIVPGSLQAPHKLRTIFVIGELRPNLDLAHVPVPIVPAMNGLGVAVVPADVPNATDGEERGHDPRHPGECHDRRQESTCGVHVAPVKMSPLLSGNGGTNDPGDE